MHVVRLNVDMEIAFNTAGENRCGGNDNRCGSKDLAAHFAEDNDAWLAAFAGAFQAMTEVGYSSLTDPGVIAPVLIDLGLTLSSFLGVGQGARSSGHLGVWVMRISVLSSRCRGLSLSLSLCVCLVVLCGMCHQH